MLFHMQKETLNLVDETGKRIGAMEKMAAHRAGMLHEAFSIFIINSRGEMMLQKRARRKYHSGGLWTNACCGHARAEEDLFVATHRRLREEMGFDCALAEAFSFIYAVALGGGVTENEFDHVFIGYYERQPHINKKEADDWRWETFSRIERDLVAMPEFYTYWFRLAFSRVVEVVSARKKNLLLRDCPHIGDVIRGMYKVSDG